MGNLGDYAIQVHSIKSTSKMIGEMNLSEMAKELEEAAKRGDRAFVVIAATGYRSDQFREMTSRTGFRKSEGLSCFA